MVVSDSNSHETQEFGRRGTMAFIAVAAGLAVTPEHIKPVCYFYPAFRCLKLFSFQSGIVSTIVIVIIMFAWPWVDASLERRLPGREASIFVVAAAIVAMTVLVLIEGLS